MPEFLYEHIDPFGRTEVCAVWAGTIEEARAYLEREGIPFRRLFAPRDFPVHGSSGPHEHPRVSERATVMLSEPCPRCGKHATVTGGIYTTGNFNEFQPDGIRWFEHFRHRLFQTTIVRFVGPSRA